MRVIILVLLTTSIIGCGWIDRKAASITGNASKACVDGVQYLQFTSGVTVQYNTDGSVKLCK